MSETFTARDPRRRNGSSSMHDGLRDLQADFQLHAALDKAQFDTLAKAIGTVEQMIAKIERVITVAAGRIIIGMATLILSMLGLIGTLLHIAH
jgi:hypothetical protein